MAFGISTVDTPFATDVASNAPDYILRVSGQEVPAGVRALVDVVEYESVNGMADQLKVVVMNPDTPQPIGAGTPSSGGISPGRVRGGGGSYSGGVLQLEDTKLFQPGNYISLALGYGADMLHIGGGIIRKNRLNFPRNAIPSIEVIAYTLDSAMMDNAPKESPKKPGQKKKGRGGRIFTDKKFSDAVKERAEDYGMDVSDVDPTPDTPSTFQQKVGMSDYDFIVGCANITGFVFWVDADENGKWFMHFKDPNNIRTNDKVWPEEDDNPLTYTFRYNDGNLSSLFSFEPEIAITSAFTKLTAVTKNTSTGEIIVVEFEEDNTETPDVIADEGDVLSVVDNPLGDEFTTGPSIKLLTDDFSIDVNADRNFSSKKELEQWARQWYRRHRENFITARGECIGVQQLRARQIHNIAGVGRGLSGEYGFRRVRHVLSRTNGYTCDFSVHKRVPELP